MINYIKIISKVLNKIIKSQLAFCNGKMKTNWEGQFFSKKNLRIQFDVVFDSESNCGIFGSLTPFGGELWRFKNFKFVRHLQPTQKIFFGIFCLNR